MIKILDFINDLRSFVTEEWVIIVVVCLLIAIYYTAYLKAKPKIHNEEDGG